VVCSDFFSAYQRLGRSVEGFTNSWCWAHMRRHVVEAAKAHPRTCGEWGRQWLGRIGDLFAAHRALVLAPAGSHDSGTARAEAARVLHDIDATRRIESVDPHTPRAAAKVLATLEREWEGLMVPIAAEGDLDNNSAERALRSPVVGRKNSYGSGAAWSAQLAADAWSITATVGLAGWNPLAHLEAYLSACAGHGGRPPEGAALLRFLPWGAGVADAARFSAPHCAPIPPTPAGRRSPGRHAASSAGSTPWAGPSSCRRRSAATGRPGPDGRRRPDHPAPSPQRQQRQRSLAAAPGP
jgi:transposase